MGDAPPSRLIALVLPSLGGGGAERAALNLASGLRGHGYQPLLVLQQTQGALLSQVPPSIEVVSLHSRRTISAVFPLMRLLRARRPGGVISFLGHTNIAAIWAREIGRVAAPLVITQHIPLSFQSREDRHWQHRALPALYRLFARRATAIVAVSDGVAADLALTAHLPRRRITTVYNPVIDRDFEARLLSPVPCPLGADGEPVFVAVGRLAPEKDVATLLRAFAAFRRTNKGKLLILGEGPLRSQLEALAADLQLVDDVRFAGFAANPLPAIRSAKALVLSSRVEGFGNVLVEALAAGVPVISTDCPYGPREILCDGAFGELVPVGDHAALAAAMERVTRRQHDPAPGKERALQFTSETIAASYLRLLGLPCPAAE